MRSGIAALARAVVFPIKRWILLLESSAFVRIASRGDRCGGSGFHDEVLLFQRRDAHARCSKNGEWTFRTNGRIQFWSWPSNPNCREIV